MDYTVISAATEEEFALRAAEHLATGIRAAIAERGRCVIGLSGGSTPRPVYTLLSAMPNIDWFKVWVFLMDERIVPKGDRRSNQFLIRSSLFTTAVIPESQFIAPDTAMDPDACVQQYNLMLASLQSKGIDIVVLGMGADGHTASLFPPVPDEAQGPALALRTTSDQPETRRRISVTLPMMTAASDIVVLLSGAEKKTTWDTMLASVEDWRRWPVKAALETGRTTVVTRW